MPSSLPYPRSSKVAQRLLEGKLFDGPDLFSVSLQANLGYDVAHEQDCLQIQGEFVPVQLDAFSFVLLQELVEIVIMFFHGAPIDEHVISSAHDAREALECF
jgi:hypothetical protein